MQTLTEASTQWANRPADERLGSIAELIQRTEHHLAESRTADIRTVTIDHDGPEVILRGNEHAAKLTHWSFGQLSARAGAPADYLRRLPAKLASECLSQGLAASQAASPGTKTELLLRANGDGLRVRAALSGQYERIWNADIAARLADLPSQGWVTPPARPSPKGGASRPATEEDVSRMATWGGMGGAAVKVGDPISPAGIYLGDRDMFVFLVNESDPIDDGTGNALCRGFFMWNSEVGAQTFGVKSFLYRGVCGNHIVWGAEDVCEVRMRHVGRSLSQRYSLAMSRTIRQPFDKGGAESGIKRAQAKIIASKKEDVIDAMVTFAKRKSLSVLTKKLCTEAMDACEQAPRALGYGDPYTVWGMVQGLTHVSQRQVNADARVAIDTAAGKVMSMAF